MKNLIVVITLLLLSGCSTTDQTPSNIKFKSICGSSSTLVCLPQYKECWCEDTDRLQRDLQDGLGGGGYHYG